MQKNTLLVQKNKKKTKKKQKTLTQLLKPHAKIPYIYIYAPPPPQKKEARSVWQNAF